MMGYSFYVLNQQIATIGTLDEWRFYAALIGFVIFASLFVIALFAFYGIAIFKFYKYIQKQSRDS